MATRIAAIPELVATPASAPSSSATAAASIATFSFEVRA